MEIYDEVYLEVPYDQKNLAKANRMTYNKINKKWSINEANENYESMVNLFSKVYLKNVFENKDIYKLNGGKWDNEIKKWYTYNCNHKLEEYFE